jgi:hypothetical protein
MNKFQHKSNLLGTFAGGEAPASEIPAIGNTIEEKILNEEPKTLENLENVSDEQIIPVDKEIINEEVNEIEEEKTEDKKPLLKQAEERLTENTNWLADEPVKLWVFNFVNKSERTIFLAFIVPPLVISIISMIHSVTFFELTNSLLLSWSLAAAFEFASISALFALTALSKINRNTIWILFGAIVLIQMIGNMYHSIINLNLSNPDLIKLFQVLSISTENLPWAFRILAFLQGGILPIISLSFVKATVEYLSFNRKDNN